jgi:hypothetical protein
VLCSVRLCIILRITSQLLMVSFTALHHTTTSCMVLVPTEVLLLPNTR